VKIQKGDIVGRKSYGKDIIFVVDRVLTMVDNTSFAILKGMTVRIEADAPIDDLEVIDKRIADENMNYVENIINEKVKQIKKNSRAIAQAEAICTGRILHLDGDRRYSEKAARYYRKLGLNAVVKNISENRQPETVLSLLRKYNPDILVITGHDAMIKNGRNYNNIYNYRNSRYFINTVKEARKWEKGSESLVIFAGACQSFFEAIMEAGANFASSPGRILIDFVDPIIVAEKIAITDEYIYISGYEIAREIKEGIRSIGGTGAKGKKKRIEKFS